MNVFLRFCIVGTIGYLIDVSTLQFIVIFFNSNLYLARIFSFIAAASSTWLLNRYFTFKLKHKPSHIEWLNYISFMFLGAVVNYLTYVFFINYFLKEINQLWLAVGAGSIAGLFINFMTSKILFKKNNSNTEHNPLI